MAKDIHNCFLLLFTVLLKIKYTNKSYNIIGLEISLNGNGGKFNFTSMSIKSIEKNNNANNLRLEKSYLIMTLYLKNIGKITN